MGVENVGGFSGETSVRGIKAKRIKHNSKINDSLHYICAHSDCKLCPIFDAAKRTDGLPFVM